MDCPKCHGRLKFREWSKRLPAKSEALAVCVGCGEKWQVRYWNGKPTSLPYQVGRCRKPVRGSYRITRERVAAIAAMWGSVQEFLDYAPLVCMSVQYKS